MGHWTKRSRLSECLRLMGMHDVGVDGKSLLLSEVTTPVYVALKKLTELDLDNISYALRTIQKLKQGGEK